MGRDMGTAVILTRPMALALSVCLGALIMGGDCCENQARAADSAIACTNPASGAHWQIRIDYERSTVDSYPARITEGKISWRDASDGGNYTLDRKSGNLTVVV